jgi:Zn-dependent metalloprotease
MRLGLEEKNGNQIHAARVIRMNSTKMFPSAVCLIFAIIAGVAANAGYVNAGASSEPDRKAAQALKKLAVESGGTLTYRLNAQTSTPSLVEGTLTKPSRHTPAWIAGTFAERYKALYGLRNPRANLRLSETGRSQDGKAFVRMEHLLFGTPVYGDSLMFTIDKQGIVRRVEGRIYPHLEKKRFNRPLHAAISPRKAERTAAAAVAGQGEPVDKPAVRLYYLPSRPGMPLVYCVTLPYPDKSETVMIHAVMGHVLERTSSP